MAELRDWRIFPTKAINHGMLDQTHGGFEMELATKDFWQLRALYARLVLSGLPTRSEQRHLEEVARYLDELFGLEWRSGGEPTFH